MKPKRGQASRKSTETGVSSDFDPIQWLIDTHPATAAWLGHDLFKDKKALVNAHSNTRTTVSRVRR
jgi:hypothetical protein